MTCIPRDAACCSVLQTGLAKLGIPLNDILHVLVATLLLGNISFYGSKSKKLEVTGGGSKVTHDRNATH